MRPNIANKRDTVEYLLERYSTKDARLIYIGDDIMDKEVLPAVNARGGLTILVAHEPRPSEAICRLDSPYSVRKWLRTLIG